VRESVDILDPSSPDLLFGFLDGDVEGLTRALSRAVKRVVVVDDNVFAIYGDKIKAYLEHHNVEHRLLVLPTNEEHKNMDMVLKIAEAIHDLGIDRRLDPVIAIGGGVCMDIVGFAASMYRRRTPYIRVPTTVMGYVDASIGAKTGVNFVGQKNKLGAYIPPVLTLLDRSFLGTLDQRQLSNGAAEILKMALVKDGELYELLANHGEELIDGKFQDAESGGSVASARVLNLAIQTMLEELAPNLWEDSLERLVDFGHVFSMELEMSVLHDEKLFHGEAVAIDMVFSSVLAHVRGHISMPYLESIIATARGLKLPVYHERMDSAQLASSLKDRIKFSQGQKIPLPTGHGVARLFNDITQEQMDEALVRWKQLCA
jgi:3-dehydroquinate synthase